MAGEWLKFESNLPEKPETLAITIAMGWDDPDLTVGKLMRLFRWFDQHTVDGNAAGVTASLLDRLIGVTGFVQAVANSGWLAISEAGLTLQNFARHNGATAKSRALTAKRVANLRGKNDEQDVCNAVSVTQALAREEKRREEKKNKYISPQATQAARAKKPKIEAPTTLAWQAYAAAYRKRYEVDPLRNASVNGQMAQFIARVPIDEAPAVAAFYVQHENGLYRNAQHPINLLLRDAESLRTQWVTGNQVVPKHNETAYAREMRDKVRQVAPSIAAKEPGTQPRQNPMDVIDVIAKESARIPH